MGSMVRALCKCGFDKTLAVGGGMMNFRSYCAFPAYCQNCRKFSTVNLLSSPARCPNCEDRKVVAYDQPEMVKRRGEHIVADWNVKEDLGRVLILTDGDYLCPSCGEYRLTFEKAGIMWD